MYKGDKRDTEEYLTGRRIDKEVAAGLVDETLKSGACQLKHLKNITDLSGRLQLHRYMTSMGWDAMLGGIPIAKSIIQYQVYSKF